MGNMGTIPATGYESSVVQTFSSPTGTSHTMTYAANVSDMVLVINNVIQEPTVAYTTSGTTLTTATLVSGDTMYIIYLALSRKTVTPGSSTITSNMIVDATIATADIADNAVTLAKMAGGTDGNIISYDASGDPVAVVTGSSGQVLTSAGAGAPPTFAAAAAGGKVLQVIQSTDMSAIFVSTSQTYADVGITLAITPSATSSKILLLLSGNFWCSQPGADYGNGIKMKMLRDSTQLNEMNTYFDFPVSGDRHAWAMTAVFNTVLLDAPSSTSALTYKMQAAKNSSYTATVKIPYPVSGTPTQYWNHCRLVAIEIGA